MSVSHSKTFRRKANLALLLMLLAATGLGACGPAAAPSPSAISTQITPEVTRMPVTKPLPGTPAASIPLSGEWRFATDPGEVGEEQGWATSDFDDAAWTAVAVPHTWGVMEEYADYEGIAWYRRAFMLPAGTQDAHLRLRFDAVFYLARVWLNGEYLGAHEGGYTPFEFDVSAIAQPGAENTLAVRVDNLRTTDRIPAVLRRDWSFDWWNYGGIVRDVSLEVTSRAYIARQQVVAVPNLVAADDAESAAIRANVTLHNASEAGLEGTVIADVLDDTTGHSVLASRSTLSVRLKPGQSTDVTLTAEVTQPDLWHFDHPHLYRWSASLLDPDGKTLHTDEVTFGIRSVELKDARFYLNGEPMRLVGLTRHADSPWYGLAETVSMMATDYDDLKALNMVFSRPVHYPQHQFIMDYCDRHGILLIPELPAWQLTERQLQSEGMRELARGQLREMVHADLNHPSVWAWSVGNEYDSKTPAGYEFTREMIEYVKSLDPSRPVGFASNRLEISPALDATRFADFVMMNQYFGTWAAPKTDLSQALDDIHAAWPDKVVVISEYGFEPHWNAKRGPPSSTLDPSEYYFIPEELSGLSAEADVQRQLVIREQMELFRSKSFVAAAIFWTYQDYRTRANFVMGVVDAERKRRASWNVLQEEYAPLLIESVAFAPPTDNGRRATVALRTRGPLDEEMPAYTLREYSLRWAVMSPDGAEALAEGTLALPALEPGTEWTGAVEWRELEADYLLTLTILRPTGFAVLERTYDRQGELHPEG